MLERSKPGRQFVAHADYVPHQTVQFEECGQSSRCSDWRWIQGDEVRMLVQHQGKGVLNHYCDQIRNLALDGTPVAFDASDSVKGASFIPINVSMT